MCGLTGFLDLATEPSALVARAEALTSTLHHRVPDAGAVWYDGDAGLSLGHRRLFIIELSPLGAQPMHSKCDRYVIVFNGEIYNFADLRTELEKWDVAFTGHSDTKVVEGFAAWGIGATLARTNGMFAIALWDCSERRFVLVRDWVGEKPLYYGCHRGAFLFASELKALHAWPGFRPEIDRDVASQSALQLRARAILHLSRSEAARAGDFRHLDCRRCESAPQTASVLAARRRRAWGRLSIVDATNYLDLPK